MKRITKTQTGFTLIELMIVVAILGILASVAIVAYQKYFERARASEATSVLSDIRIKQEAYRATFRQYFDGGGNWQPDDAPTNHGRLWPKPNPWAQLGLMPDHDLKYSYLIMAGAPGVAPAAPFASKGIDSANDFWFAAQAVEDYNLDGRCSGFEIYHGRATIAQLPREQAGNCP